MEASEIVERLTGHNGQHIAMQWRRELQTLKNVTARIEKQTTCYVRAGINYANLREVREAVESGERGEVGPLVGSDVWEVYPFIIRNEKSGALKVRVYPATFESLPRRVDYFIDGEPTTVEQIRHLCRASEFSKPGADRPACFTVKADSVVAIGLDAAAVLALR